MPNRVSVTALIAMALLSGCANTKSDMTDDAKKITASLDNYLSDLAKQANETRRITMEHQSAVLQLTEDNDIARMTEDRLVVPLGMDVPVLLNDYHGPAETMLDLLANLSGYKIEYQGPKPMEPLWITLSGRQTEAINWLRDISLQIDRYKTDVDIYVNGTAYTSDHQPRGDMPNGVMVVTYRSLL
ncbi:DotD/TraH family lipoprotein [Aliagarivorans taiwanensis]|uniref:DotD/TraH family lipoprotein n=1 Tax=Aliagarivorans taiwanensis TaxID=561966 RepID=UPI00047DD68A|nr:DotD/TraH family lipoprotein [Aliagarivorans taiwanensis]